VPGEPIVPRDRYGRPLPPPPPAKRAVTAAAEAPVTDPEPTEELLPVEPGTIVIPDFRGMGVGRALDEAHKLRLEVALSGSGQVVAQDPPPGTFSDTSRITLTFSDARRISAR